MKTFLAILLFLKFSCVNAEVDCGPYKVAGIQTQTTDVLVRLKSSGVDMWKTLGTWSAPSTKPYLSVVQEAFAMDYPVYLRFGSGYVCVGSDYVTQPYMVRVVKE